MGTPIEPGNEVQGVTPDQSETPGLNPAWNDVLSVLPEQFHSVVTPHFSKWDQSAQQRVEAANNSLKEFESFKPFVEHGITNEELEQGLRLMYEINNNPQSVYNALANAYNFNQGAEAAKSEEDEEETPNTAVNDPRYDQLNEHLELVSKIVLSDAEAKQAAQQDTALNNELEKLKADFGEYDEDYVLTKMMNGMSGEDAVKAYQKLVTPKSFAPTLLGNSSGGSGLPSNAIDPTKLSGKETRNLVAEYLAAASKTQN
jgi:hypothetical protein